MTLRKKQKAGVCLASRSENGLLSNGFWRPAGFPRKRRNPRLAALLIVLLALTSAYGQMTPSQDAYTDSAHPTTNYGAAITLGVASTGSSIQTTYIQFDLSSIPSGYTGSNIAKATLRIYVNLSLIHI